MSKSHPYHRFSPSVPTCSERMGASVRTTRPYKGRGTDTDGPRSLEGENGAIDGTDARQELFAFADEPFPQKRKPKPPVVPVWVEGLKQIKERERARLAASSPADSIRAVVPAQVANRPPCAEAAGNATADSQSADVISQVYDRKGLVTHG